VQRRALRNLGYDKRDTGSMYIGPVLFIFTEKFDIFTRNILEI